MSLFKTHINRDSKLWFLDAVNDPEHQARVAEVENIREYLLGNHNILRRPDETFSDKIFQTSKIVLNTARSIVDAHCSYIISNPVTLARFLIWRMALNINRL